MQIDFLKSLVTHVVFLSDVLIIAKVSLFNFIHFLFIIIIKVITIQRIQPLKETDLIPLEFIFKELAETFKRKRILLTLQNLNRSLKSLSEVSI